MYDVDRFFPITVCVALVRLLSMMQQCLPHAVHDSKASIQRGTRYAVDIIIRHGRFASVRMNGVRGVRGVRGSTAHDITVCPQHQVQPCSLIRWSKISQTIISGVPHLDE